MTQLPLFTSDGERQVQAELTWLRQRLDHAKAIFRQQQAELDAAKHEAATWCGRCLVLQDELEHAGGMASDERREFERGLARQARTIEEQDQRIRQLHVSVEMYRQLATWGRARPARHTPEAITY